MNSDHSRPSGCFHCSLKGCGVSWGCALPSFHTSISRPERTVARSLTPAAQSAFVSATSFLSRSPERPGNTRSHPFRRRNWRARSSGADPNAYAESNNLKPLKAILLGWGLSGRDPRFAPKEEERYKAAWALIQAGGDPHFRPEGHPPPFSLAKGIGGEIGRLYAKESTNPE